MAKRVVLIKADGTIEVLTPGSKPTLEQMQAWVDGYIIPIRSVRYDGKTVVMVVNEEGLLRGLPLNKEASRLAGTLIVGDVFLLEGWRL